METKQATSDKTSDKSKRLVPVDEVLKGIEFCKARYSEKGDNELPPILVKFAVQILDILRIYIEQLQTTNSSPVVHGHWKPSDDPILYNIYGVAVCSVCGYDYAGNNTKYCPECGAKMDEGKRNGLNPDIVIIDESEVPSNG